MRNNASKLFVNGLLLQWCCLWYKGFTNGFPSTDHTHYKSPPPIFIQPNGEPSMSKSDARFPSHKMPTTKPFSMPLSQASYYNGPDITKDYEKSNFNNQPPFSLYLQEAYVPHQQQKVELTNPLLSTPVTKLSERDGPLASDRQIPELLLITQHALGMPSNQENEKPKADGQAPYFTVMASPETRPDDMHDYAFLDENDDMLQSSLTPPQTTPMLPKIMKPMVTQTPKPVANKENASSSKDSLQTSTLNKLKVINTETRRVNSILTTPAKRRSTLDDRYRDYKSPAKRQQLKLHNEQKRSPQQDISYVPAFRRRQTATNIYNNVADHNFAHSALGQTSTNGFIPQIPAFQTNPYNYYTNINTYGGFAPPFNNVQHFLPYAQFSSFAGGPFPNPYNALSNGYPNLAISYQVPLFTSTSGLPPYLNGGNYNSLNGFNQGSFVPPFRHGPESLGVVNPLHSQFSYPLNGNPFTATLGSINYPSIILTRNDIRKKNGTNVHIPSHELESLNGFAGVYRHTINGGTQPNSNEFMQTFYSALGPQLQPVNPLFPIPPSSPPAFVPNNQFGFLPNPQFVGASRVENTFPQEITRPIFRDNTELGNQFTGIQNGPFSTPDSQPSSDDHLDFPSQEEKTVSNETRTSSNESNNGDEDAQRFKPLSGDKAQERPNAEIVSFSTKEKVSPVTENQQNTIKTAPIPLEKYDRFESTPNDVQHQVTTSLPAKRPTAQDRISAEKLPHQSITYLGDNYLSHKPVFFTYFYPKNYKVSGSLHHKPPLNLDYPGFSINDPQLLQYVKARQEPQIIKINTGHKKGKNIWQDQLQECTDLFGNKVQRCKISKHPIKIHKPKYRPKPNFNQPHFDVLSGGVYEGSFQENHPFSQHEQLPNHPHPKPPQTIPITQLERIILSQSQQGGWRPMLHIPSPVKRHYPRPIYNRQHFQELSIMAISPHSHPANKKV